MKFGQLIFDSTSGRLARGRSGDLAKQAILIIALAATPAFADDVHLRGGGLITGVIVEQTEDSITVDVGGGGTITAQMSSVVGIDESVSPLQEFRDRADAIPDGDAEAWRELAKWATGNALSSQALRAWSEVVAILPDDEEANRALGRVQLDGRWVSEEDSYLARGYVKFEGQWMTPGERQQILTERQGREDADRQANQAKIDSLDAEIQADKRRKEEETEAAWNRNSVGWGWGYGPGYWPYGGGGVRSSEGRKR